MRYLSFFAALLLPILLLAQAPQAFDFQGVARDASGNVLSSESISLRISILTGSSGGALAYQETHSVVTSPFGLFTIQVGNGTPTQSTFPSIGWGTSSHFIQVELDASGGSDFQDMGTTQLLSVPYALHARAVDCFSVSLLGDTLKQGNGCFVIIPGISVANGGCLDLDGDGVYENPGCSDPIDCDDNNATVYPGAPDLCGDGLDNDCDGVIDNNPDVLAHLTWYLDSDGDGFGDASVSQVACAQPAGHVDNGTDCDDADPLLYPGAGCSDSCSPSDAAWVDQNQALYFELATIEWVNCILSGDGSPECITTALDAGGGTPLSLACHTCVAQRFACITQSCISQCLEPGAVCNACIQASGCDAAFIACMGLTDADSDGWAAGSDCDDTDPLRNPGAEEACDGIDNDCDGNIDEGTSAAWFPDADGDGFGDSAGMVIACTAPDPSYVQQGFDCDDQDPQVFPYQGCPGLDCGNFYGVDLGECQPGTFCENGICLTCLDEDGDGFTVCDGDCNDADPTIHPGAPEGCNGVDSNCDGLLNNSTGAEVYSPNWTVQASTGETVDLFGLLAQGKTVVLDLFAAWCAPSQQMLTSNFLQDWNAHMGPAGTDQIRIVAAAVDQNAGNLAPFIAAAQWPVIVQNAEDLGTLYNSIGMFDSAVPTLLMICPDRKVTMLFPQNDVLPYTGSFVYDAVASSALLDASCACNLTPCLGNIGCMDPSACNFDPAATCPGPCVAAIEYFLDNDGDGFGSVSLGTFCSQPNNSAINGGDCDDNNPFVVPFSEEICGNGIDENCDGQVDEDCPCVPGTVEPCTGSDIGACDPGTRTCQFDGTWGFCEGELGPIPEFCDGIDNDCNGLVDDDPIDGQTWFRDADGDGFGTSSETVNACSPPSGFVDNSSDCDDTNAAINPAAPEACNTIDDDCDGHVDEGACAPELCDGIDNNGNGLVDADDPALVLVLCEQQQGACSGVLKPAARCVNGAWLTCTSDDYQNGSPFYATTESCDGIDNDCDGQEDEGFNLATDTQNCGACGIVCPPGTNCVNGLCVE